MLLSHSVTRCYTMVTLWYAHCAGNRMFLNCFCIDTRRGNIGSIIRNTVFLLRLIFWLHLDVNICRTTKWLYLWSCARFIGGLLDSITQCIVSFVLYLCLHCICVGIVLVVCLYLYCVCVCVCIVFVVPLKIYRWTFRPCYTV